MKNKYGRDYIISFETEAETGAWLTMLRQYFGLTLWAYGGVDAAVIVVREPTGTQDWVAKFHDSFKSSRVRREISALSAAWSSGVAYANSRKKETPKSSVNRICLLHMVHGCEKCGKDCA